MLRQEDLFKVYVENSFDVIFAIDPQGCFLYASPAWQRHFGYPQSEVLGQSFTHFAHPEDIPFLFDYLQTCLNTKHSASSPRFRVRCHNGEFKWFIANGNYCEDENGTPFYLGVGHEITEQILVEESLKASQKQFQDMVQHASGVVYQLAVYPDKGLEFTYVSPKCVEMLDMPADRNSPRWQTMGDYVHAEDQPHFYQLLQESISQAKPFHFEGRVLVRGYWKWIQIHSEPVQQDFGILFNGIILDVSDTKETQENLRQKNVELERYLYIASHDLRSPLINITGFSQLLETQLKELNQSLKSIPYALRQSLTEEIPQSLSFIRKGVSKMESLINGLLKISRTGRIAMEWKKIKMNELMDSVLQNLQFEIHECKANISCQSLLDCRGDYELLHQAFTNLVSNSIKYRSKDRILQISIHSVAVEGYINYVIRDNGIGIAKNQLPKIWDVFYRASSSQEIYGEGIGLSIVHRIVEKHLGKVSVKSEIHTGSTFVLSIPSESLNSGRTV